MYEIIFSSIQLCYTEKTFNNARRVKKLNSLAKKFFNTLVNIKTELILV